LALLVGRQEGHPACEKLSGGISIVTAVRFVIVDFKEMNECWRGCLG